jgi:type VI secretion system secreted protein VgrG
MPSSSENAILLKLHSPLGEKLEIRQLDGSEELGRLFAYDLELRSTDYEISPNDLLGKPVAVELQPTDMPGRVFHGMVTSFYYVGEGARHAKYRATIRPWLWLLSNRGTCRIFQNKTAPTIIEEVFRDAGFSDFSMSLNATYRKREYCVQYSESDFNFVSRLMEEEGIYYYFTHEQSKHTLKLVDASSGHAATALGGLPYHPHAAKLHEQSISSWSSARHLQTGKIMLNEYNFETPAADLSSRAAQSRAHAANDLEYYSHPGPYPIASEGGHYATTRLEERQAEHHRAQGSGIITSLVCGETFELKDHPRTDLNVKYIAVSTTYQATGSSGSESGEGGEDTCTCTFTALPTTETFRSASTTVKPRIRGPQTALVVGPSGKEIWTDKYGRVKLHFYWDLLSQKKREQFVLGPRFAGVGWHDLGCDAHSAHWTGSGGRVSRGGPGPAIGDRPRL